MRFLAPLACLSLFLSVAQAAPKWNVAIVVHNGVELLDFAGPAEVFQQAAWRARGPDGPLFNVYTVAPGEGPIDSMRLVTVQPAFTTANCPDPNIIVIPGGQTDVLLDDPAFMGWVRAQADGGDTVLTVCTGAFVAAKAGLLDGKSATTHHSSYQGLRDEYPSVTVIEDAKVVDSGSVLTSGGISSGIEGSLHLVARLVGGLAALDVARHMEYRWEAEHEYAPLNPQLDPVAATALGMKHLRRLERYEEAIALAEDEDAAWGDSGADGTMPPAVQLEWASCHLMMGHTEQAVQGYREVIESGRAPRYARYNLACALSRQGLGDEACDALLAELEVGPVSPALVMSDSDLVAARASARFELVRARLGLDPG